MILRACVKCGKPSPASHCSEHKPKPWATSERRQRMGMSGGAWETVRRRVLKRDSTCCYLCGKVGATEVDHLLGPEHNELPALASAHHQCHRRRHTEPEWAAERVQMALEVLGK
jgi:5-methylcytosine-specific restriction endonuclease McrA